MKIFRVIVAIGIIIWGINNIDKRALENGIEGAFWSFLQFAIVFVAIIFYFLPWLGNLDKEEEEMKKWREKNGKKDKKKL